MAISRFYSNPYIRFLYVLHQLLERVRVLTYIYIISISISLYIYVYIILYIHLRTARNVWPFGGYIDFCHLTKLNLQIFRSPQATKKQQTLGTSRGESYPEEKNPFIQGNPSCPPQSGAPPRNKGLIFGLIKGNQWLISPDHKALFLGG